MSLCSPIAKKLIQRGPGYSSISGARFEDKSGKFINSGAY